MGESIEDLNEVSELVKGLMQKEKGQCEKAVLLKKIAIKLQPYIQGISMPVSLAWGMSIDGDEYTAVSPKSRYRVNDLSSGKGIVLWSPSTRSVFSSSPTSDQLWLLSSGKFLYIKTSERKADRGIDRENRQKSNGALARVHSRIHSVGFGGKVLFLPSKRRSIEPIESTVTN